jgi:O-antigen ligase
VRASDPDIARRHRARRAATTAAPLSLGVCLIVSPQLLGGVFGWGISVVAALSAIACAAAAWASRADGSTIRLDRASYALLAILAFTALQALPLPRAVTELAQPTAVQMADTAAALLGEPPPSWVPLSIAPGSTRAELVKGAAIVATFLAAWLLVSLGHRRQLVYLVALSTVAMAVVALGHLAVDADRVFGLYQQVHTGTALLAPLLNQNQLSGFLAMGVPLLLGLALEEEEDRGKRLGYLVGATLVGATSLLAVSRGGVAGLVCGLLALAGLGLARRRRGRRPLGPAYAILTATAGAIAALGLYAGFERLYADFEVSDISKLELGAQGLSLALDHPWLGVGRGAFSAAFVSQHGSTERFTHPENLVAQWTSEWGLVAAVVLLALLGHAVVRAVAEAAKWSRLGAAAGLVAIVVHDLVDFALEMAGVAVVGAALLAAVIGPRRSSRPTDDEGRGPRALHVAAGVSMLALALVGALGWRIDGESVNALQQRLTELARSGDREAFRSTLLEAVRLHPAEPVFPLLGGAEAVRHDDPRAVAWLNRAMFLAPGWSSPHVETARLLWRQRRIEQALLELREAEARQPGTGTALACSILLQRAERTAQLVRIAGDGSDGIAWLDRVVGCLPVTHPAAVSIDVALAERGGLRARLRQADRALHEQDGRRALRALEPVRDTRDTDVQLTRARAYLALDDPRRAVEVLRRAEGFTDRPQAVLRMRAEAEARARDEEAMRATMERLRGHAGGRSTVLAELWVHEGNLERGLGNVGRALEAFERAHRLDPSSPGLASVASLAEQTGELGRALRAHAELCRRTGPDAPSCQAHARILETLGEPPPYGMQPLGTP